jgi:hypothetical protein
MWMGGFAPLGDVVKDRKLVASASEAAIVRLITPPSGILG